MLPTTNERFIAQMKLRELQTQRRMLLAAYATLTDDLAKVEVLSGQVALLYERLRDLTFAGHQLHPMVHQLDVLIHKVRAGLASTETLTLWHERLLQEVATGQRRTNIMYVFGMLLEESFAAPSTIPGETEQQQQRYQDALLSFRQPASPGDYRTLLDIYPGPNPLFPTQTQMSESDLANGDYDLQYTPEGQLQVSFDHGATYIPFEQISGPTFTPLYQHIKTQELEAVLEIVRLDRYRTPEVRAQATRIIADPTVLKELADALTIQIQHLDEWQWPPEGVPITVRWQRAQYRVYVDEDLPTTCLLEVLGARWQNLGNQHLSGSLHRQLQELRRLDDRKVPIETITGALDRVPTSPSPFVRYHRDIWALEPPAPLATDPIERVKQLLALYGEHNSLLLLRASREEQLRHFDQTVSYHDRTQAAGVAPGMVLIQAELALARVRFPERPLYIAKADIRQFYPSLSHRIILEELRRLGLTGPELTFFARYLAIPIRDGAQTFISQRGVPLNRKLADMLAELVLRILDMSIQAAANVQIIRLVDDITFIATDPQELVRGWNAMKDGLVRLGLELNEAKSGAVAINGQLPEGVPTTEPRWMMVTLGNDGEWHVDGEQVEAFREATARLVEQAPTALSAVSIYNYQIAYLEQALMTHVWLGPRYQQAMFVTLVRFHEALFGTGQGILQALAERLRQRNDGAILDIPEAWFYWPITAGGMAVHEPAIFAGSFSDLSNRSEARTIPTVMAADWQHNNYEWSRFYANLTQPLQQVDPESDPVMETLVGDFIQRGRDLSQGRQQGLSTYWRWILASYGPQLLAAFGSFRFLFSELVPLQLVTNRIEALSDDPDAL